VAFGLKLALFKNLKPFHKLSLIFLLVVLALALTHEVLWWDEAVYVNNALSLAGVHEPWRFVALERQPATAFLEAAAFLVFGGAGFFLVAFFGAVSLVFLAYSLVKALDGTESQAFFAGLIVLFSPPFLVSGYTFASDAWGAALSLAALFFYVDYLKKGGTRSFLLSLLFASLSFWFRDIYLLTGLGILFWEFFEKKSFKRLAVGALVYFSVIAAFFIDSAGVLGDPLARLKSHASMILLRIGYSSSNPLFSILSWALFFVVCYGLFFQKILFSCAAKKEERVLVFFFAINAFSLLFLDSQLRYALLPVILLACVYSLRLGKEDFKTKWIAFAIPAVIAIAFYSNSFFLGPENVGVMGRACSMAETVKGDLYTEGNAPFLSQCSKRPVYSLDLGCEGGSVLSFDKKNFEPFVQSCLEYERSA